MSALTPGHNGPVRAIVLCVAFFIFLGPLLVSMAEAAPSEGGATAPKYSVGDFWEHETTTGVTYRLTVSSTGVLVNGTDSTELERNVTRQTPSGPVYFDQIFWVRSTDIALVKIWDEPVTTGSPNQTRQETRYLDPPVETVKFPLTVGLVWEIKSVPTYVWEYTSPNGTYVHSKKGEPGNMTVEVLGIENVTVKAGTFKAFKIKNVDQYGITVYYYYSWEVGNTVKEEDGTGMMTSQLVSFKCANPGKWTKDPGSGKDRWTYFGLDVLSWGYKFYLFIMLHGVLFGVLIGLAVGAATGYSAKLPKPSKKHHKEEEPEAPMGPSRPERVEEPVIEPLDEPERGPTEETVFTPVETQAAPPVTEGATSLGGTLPATPSKERKRFCPRHGCRTQDRGGQPWCDECGGIVQRSAMEMPKYCPKDGSKAVDKDGAAWCEECDASIGRKVKYCPEHGCKVETKEDGPWCPECNGPVTRKWVFCPAHGYKYVRKDGVSICPDCQEEGAR